MLKVWLILLRGYGENDSFFALNPDGTLNWTYNVKMTSSSAFIDKDGTIYFTTRYNTPQSGKFFALNPDGTLKWNSTIPEYGAGSGYYSTSPSMSSDGTLYITGGYGGRNVYAINSSTGSIKWKHLLGTNITPKSSPVIGSDGTIYVGVLNTSTTTNPNMIYALNSDGTVKWTKSFPGLSNSGVHGISIAKDGTIYASSNQEGLYALNPDGMQKWFYNTTNSHPSTVTIGADGTIYFTAGDTIALNPNGTLKWKYYTGNANPTTPIIDSNGVLYVNNAGYMGGAINWASTLYAFAPVTNLVANMVFNNTEPFINELVNTNLTISNLLQDPANNSVLSFLIPNNFEYISNNDSAIYDPIKRTLTWHAGDIQGNSKTVLNVVLKAIAIGPGIFNASSSTDSYEKNIENNISTTLNVRALPIRDLDLEISKIANKNIATNGDIIEYTIKVLNKGPSVLYSSDVFFVNDTVPLGFNLINIYTNNGTYDKLTGSWTGVNLNPGDFVTLVIHGLISYNTTGNLTNFVNVTAPNNTLDINTSNNNANVTILIINNITPNNNSSNNSSINSSDNLFNNNLPTQFNAKTVSMEKTGLPLILVALVLLFTVVFTRKYKE